MYLVILMILKIKRDVIKSSVHAVKNLNNIFYRNTTEINEYIGRQIDVVKNNC